jgi:CheY-like chemotaxis protein
MNILVIEDELMVRQTLVDLLELNGHTVLAAADGIEGVKLAERRPDLILCDIRMPGMDGYEVIAAIQKLPQCRDIPFIFLTARAGRGDQRRGMALGADDYITKPFTERDIVEAIAARVRRQQPLRERIQQLLDERHRESGADWSHVLMTPLNGVLGGLQLIESEAESIEPGELKELLGLIRASAEREHALSRKLVLYYELERLKAAPPALASCDAPAAVAAGAARAAEEGKRSSDLTVHCDPGSVPVAEAFLTAGVAELAENAFQFSKPGEPVTVTGTCHSGRYRIEIADQGPGMTAEQRARATGFTQFEKGRRNQQGLGLGLAIARIAAELAGGQLLLEAAGPGQRGLRACLDLPFNC